MSASDGREPKKLYESDADEDTSFLLRLVMALVAKANSERTLLITEDELNSAGDVRMEQIDTADGQSLRVTVLNYKSYQDAVADGDIAEFDTDEEWDEEFNAPADVLEAIRKKH